SYERDAGLQHRTGEVYAELAAAQWCGRWLVAPEDADPDRLAARLRAGRAASGGPMSEFSG
ncbi:MAG: hypothetical protein ACK5M9_12870, partial [Mycobacterium sp.]